jgi:hypothetical protein
MLVSNQFIKEAKNLIYTHGVSVDIKSVTTGAYNVETGGVTNTETSTTVTAFPKTVVANSYNYPNLIGKKLQEFLVVASDLTQAPKAQDTIHRASDVLTIERVSEHAAGGAIIIYKLLAVKS